MPGRNRRVRAHEHRGERESEHDRGGAESALTESAEDGKGQDRREQEQCERDHRSVDVEDRRIYVNVLIRTHVVVEKTGLRRVRGERRGDWYRVCDHMAIEEERDESEGGDAPGRDVPAPPDEPRPQSEQERRPRHERCRELARQDAEGRRQDREEPAAASMGPSQIGEDQEEEAQAKGVLVHVPRKPERDEIEGGHSDQKETSFFAPSEPAPAECVQREAEEAVEKGRGALRHRERGRVRRDRDESQQHVDEGGRLLVQDLLQSRDEPRRLNVSHERSVDPDRVEPQRPRPCEEFRDRADDERKNGG